MIQSTILGTLLKRPPFMSLKGVAPILFGSLLFATSAYGAPGVGNGMHSVGNSDIEIRIQAGVHSLRLASIAVPGTGVSWKSSPKNESGLAFPKWVRVGDKVLPIQWKRKAVGKSGSHDLVFIYVSDLASLELSSHWKVAPAGGPVEHEILVSNRSQTPVELPIQRSILFTADVPGEKGLTHTWVEKSAGGPSDAGTHIAKMAPGYRSKLESGPYSEDKPHDAIPWSSVCMDGDTAGIYMGVEFSGKVDLLVRRTAGGQLTLDAGQSSQEGDSTRLMPGEAYHVPIVFLGAHLGGTDAGGNQMRKWLRAKVCPQITDPNYPLLTLNSWGSGMAIDEGMAASMSKNAAKLGLELFHIDAGWFQTVGDWRPSTSKFPNGLQRVSQAVKAQGLKFGLWTGWTQGGLGDDLPEPEMTLNVFSPQRRTWFASPPKSGWKPEDFVGSDVCLADTDAQKWSLTMLDNLVKHIGIDMLEHDQRMVVSHCDQQDHSHTGSSTDIAYRAALGYYDVYDQLKKRHPNLMLEDCVNGGRMVDYGVLKRVSYISISDTYTPLANRQAFYDNSFALPPAVCECYVSDRELPKTDEEFLTMLRSGMMGWFTLMQDPATWSPHRFELAKLEFHRFKTLLRPLVRNGDLYHSLPRPKLGQWDGVQYCSADATKSIVMAFRGGSKEEQITIPLRGLNKRWTYRVIDPKMNADLQDTGEALMRNGLKVSLSETNGSTIVELAVVRRNRGATPSASGTKLR